MTPVMVCPLGSKCEEIKNNQLLRCHWYTNVKGKHPQSEEMVDQWGCAMTWLPIVLVESTQVNRGTSSAIESLRNEMVKGQAEFEKLMLISKPKAIDI